MSSIRDLLHEADPLRRESETSADDLALQRRTLLKAAATRPVAPEKSRPRTSLCFGFALVAAMACVIAAWLWSPLVNNVQAAVQFEVRLVESEPGPGLQAATIEGGGTVYLHNEAVITNSDIARAEAIQRPGGTDFLVSVTFTPAGASKMEAATERNIGKRMAILIDGVVVSAPVVNSVLRDSAVVDGKLTQQEAHRIVSGIKVGVGPE